MNGQLVLACCALMTMSALSQAQEHRARHVAARPLPLVEPSQARMSREKLSGIDDLVTTGLEQRKMPGCVVAVGRKGRLVYLKAFGNRQLLPAAEPMTTDTLFDLASLTKPLATTSCIMKLVEEHQLALHHYVAEYLPEFGNHGKEWITVFHLLTHQSGLVADNALADYRQGCEQAWQNICALELQAAPGESFIYSDVGFIVLAELVKRVSGKPLNQFASEQFWTPLGMQETAFRPSALLRERAATTEQRDHVWLRGEVHDPRADLLGGVAGHAGLFSTAQDLAVYASMLLADGCVERERVLQQATVRRMTSRYPVTDRSGNIVWRGLGWDKQSGYSTNRGDRFSPAAFGHGGFTGTALWIDPALDLFVIFLSNRVHPDGKGSVNSLAGRIGTLAAEAIETLPIAEVPAPAVGVRQVQCGIDVLQRQQYRLLAGRRVGLITNHTGLAHDGTTTVMLLDGAPDVQLVRLFSPEHGLAGKLDIARIADSQEATTGLEIVSLYGASRKPTAEHLAGVDTLVFDMQDVGTRFYTYISTMGYAMRAAAEHDVQFVVLDRPNPINGWDVDGPLLDEGRESFVGFHTLPVRYGMTIGELALLLRHELRLDLDLHIVRLEGWHRQDYFDATGLLWVNPSPNMRTLNQALLYPGVGLLETTNVSVGRGTDTPFELIGAPWINAQQLAANLNNANLKGVRFVPIRFTPKASKYAEVLCSGVSIVITNRQECEPLTVGWELARQLKLLCSDHWDANAYDRLLASRATFEAVMAGRPVADICAGYRAQVDRFLVRRAPWLLYHDANASSGTDDWAK